MVLPLQGISRDYFVRRQAVRAAWVPESEVAILQLQQLRGVLVRFVVGFSHSEEAMEVLKEEVGLYGDMIRLDVLEKYHNLVLKMRRYMQWATQHYSFDYLLKVSANRTCSQSRLLTCMLLMLLVRERGREEKRRKRKGMKK